MNGYAGTRAPRSGRRPVTGSTNGTRASGNDGQAMGRPDQAGLWRGTRTYCSRNRATLRPPIRLPPGPTSGETVIETPDNGPPTARTATWKDSVSPRSASIEAAVRRPGADQYGMRTVDGLTQATGEPAEP